MSLREEVGRETRQAAQLDVIVAQLGKKDGAELLELLDDPGVSGGAIYRALRNRGLTLAESTVYGWKRKANR